MKKTLFYVFFLLLASFLSCSAWSENTVLVLSLEKKEYAGEISQRQGVTEALRELLPTANAETVYLDDSNVVEAVVKKVRAHGGPVVLLSGHTFGPDVLQEICKKLPTRTREKMLTVLTGHQMWRGWGTLSKKYVDIVALPAHVFAENPDAGKSFRRGWEQSDQPLLVKTVGVSHGLSGRRIETDFLASQRNAVQPWRTNKKVLLVVLGGDVQKSDGTWAHYTPEEAEHLVHLVKKVKKARKADYVIVTNGPRTGKVDESGGNATVPCHTLDPVTEAFTQALSKSGTPYVLKNFVFGQPSKFRTLLGLVRVTEGVALIPGESTSMISESIDVLPLGSVIVFKHSAMRAVHDQHIDAECKLGRVSAIYQRRYGRWEKSSAVPSGRLGAPKNAAQTIAEAIHKALP